MRCKAPVQFGKKKKRLCASYSIPYPKGLSLLCHDPRFVFSKDCRLGYWWPYESRSCPGCFKAGTHRHPSEGVIHHSDKGSQYTSQALKLLADRFGIQLSTGRVANAFDNAVAESFFHTLKTEHVYFQNYKNLEEAKMDIFYYV